MKGEILEGETRNVERPPPQQVRSKTMKGDRCSVEGQASAKPPKPGRKQNKKSEVPWPEGESYLCAKVLLTDC